MKISLREMCFILLVIVATIVSALIANDIGKAGSTEALKACGIVCLVHFIIVFIAIQRITGKIFTLYNCYLLAFFFFQCGQYVIYGLGAEYNYFYLERYDIVVVISAVVFSILCNGAAALAVPFSMTNKAGRIERAINQLNSREAFLVSRVIFGGLSLIEIPYVLIRFFIVMRSGYSAVRALEESLPSFMSFIDMLYIPSVLLCMIYTEGNRKPYAYVIAGWAVINALNGDRSTGIAALVLIGLLYLNGVLQRKETSKGRFRIILFVVLALFAGYLILYAYSFRNHLGNTSYTSLFSLGTEVLGEIGFSFFPLVAIMLICPSHTGFLYGKPIFFSIIAGIFPMSLDLTGLIRQAYNIAKTAENWLTTYYDFSFGLGFSLDAEAYSNFGMLGFIWILIQSTFVAKVLSEPDFTREDNKFSQYKSLALLFVLFTMPRRWTYYLVNFYVYYVLVIALVLWLFRGEVKQLNK